jgi:hypothetical protein
LKYLYFLMADKSSFLDDWRGGEGEGEGEGEGRGGRGRRRGEGGQDKSTSSSHSHCTQIAKDFLLLFISTTSLNSI